jgi:peptidoglycan/LPS O-acetylase OafA/YrhL
LLLKEIQKTGRVSLKDFYIRRVLRIFPAFYVYMVVITFLAILGTITLRQNDLLFSFLYIINFHADHSWHVGHLWSLAVEEQFYLLWPTVIALCSRRRAFQIAAVVFFASPFIRLGFFYFLPFWREGIGHMFPTVADSLATGCLLAGMRNWLHERSWYMKLLEPRPFLLMAIVALGANFLQDRPRIEIAVGESLMNLAIVICIDRCITYPSGLVGRVLEWKPLAFIGVLSYSLYIWQQPFLNRTSTSPLASFPLNMVLVAVAALLSYYVIEQPFLKLKSRFGGRPKPADRVGSAAVAAESN